MSIPSFQIWVSTIILQQKELGIAGDMAESRYGKGTIQNEPGAISSAKKWVQTNKQKSNL